MFTGSSDPYPLATYDGDIKGGWTIEPAHLNKIREKILASGFNAPCLEEIESVLLVVTGCKRNPNAKPDTEEL